MAQNIGGRGRPSSAFYLNEEQALLVCIFSETENAALVRKQVISTFMAYRRGQLPVQQTPAMWQQAIPTRLRRGAPSGC